MKQVSEFIMPAAGISIKRLCLPALLLIMCALPGCKKDKAPTPAEPDHWKPVTEITYSAKNGTYCFSDGEVLTIRSLSATTTFNKDHSLKERYIHYSLPAFGYRQFPMASDLIVTIENEFTVAYRSVKNKDFSWGFSFGQDTDFVSLYIGDNYVYKPAYLLSPDGYFVFETIYKNDLYATPVIRHAYNPYYFKKVKLPGPRFSLVLNCFYGGKFYMSDNYINKALYTLDTFGNYEKIASRRFETIVEANGTFYGISDWRLYLSGDEGYNWTATTVHMPTYNMINVDNKIMYFKYDAIAELQVEGSDIKSRLYNSKGLEGNEITWICKHNDRYYCTTKSGVYYIEEKYFHPQ